MGSSDVSRGSGLDTQLQQCCKGERDKRLSVQNTGVMMKMLKGFTHKLLVASGGSVHGE